MSDTSRNSGFTLLELLIALVLLSTLVAALYGSYFAVIRARDRAASGMESRRELAATLDLVRREISSALYSRTEKRLHFVVEDRDNFGTAASTLEYTTMAPPSLQERRESGVVQVSYRMAEKNGTRLLTRQEKDLVAEDTPPAYPQMERISSFLVECFDGSKWVKSWDTGLNGALPKAVRITIEVAEEGKPVRFEVLATPRIGAL